MGVCLLLVLLIIPVRTVSASSKPGKTSKVSLRYGVYYDYIKKNHLNGGDAYNAQISWKKVQKASGYKVKLYWANDDAPGLYVWSVNVKKSGGKYIFTSKKEEIAKSVGVAYKKGKTHRFTSKKLSFYVDGGSSEYIKKVSVKSYKIKNGKKIYGKAKTLNCEGYVERYFNQ